MSYLITHIEIASGCCRVFRIDCFHSYIIVMRRFTLAEKWQAVGMAQAGFRNRGMVGQIGAHHYLMDHLIQRLQATRIVDERP